jgi:NAD dependent epimerase/dehydratase family enzyme
VIGNNKFIKHITRIFKLGLGGKIGHGEYAMPFIHIDDLVKFYDVAIKDENYSGVYNLVAPDIITNEDFAVALGNILGKNPRFSLPYFLLKALIGERIISITGNPIVIPKRLLEAGFIFKYDQISKALEQVIPTK